MPVRWVIALNALYGFSRGTCATGGRSGSGATSDAFLSFARLEARIEALNF
jgi:hypothetical protein